MHPWSAWFNFTASRYKGRRERIERLERKDLLFEHYARTAPKALDSLVPEERHHI